MRKCLILFLICLMCVPAASAAQWREGLSAARPYEWVEEVDLNAKMGYDVMYPGAQLPAERFCDVLEIYLPREDVVPAEGVLSLYDENGKVDDIRFDDPNAVEIRPLEEAELEGLMWGGGVCVEIHLPESLRLGGEYYVLMDEACFTAANGKAKNPAITATNAWQPRLTGDFGVGALKYLNADGEKVEWPEVGDAISLELVLGGEAASAVVYSDRDSVFFDPVEYTESGVIAGKVTGEQGEWGVVFLNDSGTVVDVVALHRD